MPELWRYDIKTADGGHINKQAEDHEYDDDTNTLRLIADGSVVATFKKVEGFDAYPIVGDDQ